MKTFKIAQLLVVALFVVGSINANRMYDGNQMSNGKRGCCASKCSKKGNCATVRLPIEQVSFEKTINESCGQPPTIKYHVTKEVIPCSNKNTERVECLTSCPIYGGTYDAQTGDRID